MWPVNDVQHSRYEFKYLVSETQARDVRHYVQAYLEPDPYTQGREGYGYEIYSLYLDSPDLATCRATQTGLKNRFKLRVRFYGGDPTSPLFCEVKRRDSKIIKKSRAKVRRACGEMLISGEQPDRTDLVNPDDESALADLLEFCRLRDALNAIPAAYTRYWREGYEMPGCNVVRVTFDRKLRTAPYTGTLNPLALGPWEDLKIEGVVLELKFTDRFPNWMKTLVESFDLVRGPFAKYVKCVTHLSRVSEDIPITPDAIMAWRERQACTAPAIPMRTGRHVEPGTSDDRPTTVPRRPAGRSAAGSA